MSLRGNCDVCYIGCSNYLCEETMSYSLHKSDGASARFGLSPAECQRRISTQMCFFFFFKSPALMCAFVRRDMMHKHK